MRSQHWSDEMWKSTMAKGGGNKKNNQYCTDPSGQEILLLRALQGHSGRNIIDPALQDNVLILNNFFEYICHIGCADQCTLHHEFRIDTRRTKFEQKTDGILHICKEHKDPDVMDLNAPRHAQYMHKAWKKHQITVDWVDTKLAQQKGFKFYQTRSNAIIFYDTLPAYCIPKAIMMGSGEIIYEKENASPRPAPKISFKYNWMKELGCAICVSDAHSGVMTEHLNTTW